MTVTIAYHRLLYQGVKAVVFIQQLTQILYDMSKVGQMITKNACSKNSPIILFDTQLSIILELTNVRAGEKNE